MKITLGPNEDHNLIIFSPQFTLSDLDGEAWILGRILQQAPYAMLVFFSPQDCPACLSESVLWTTVDENVRISVIGIAKHSNERELRVWVSGEKISFPILFDHNGEVMSLFRIRETPVKLLIDGHGRMLLRDSSRSGSREQQEFLKILDDMIH